ncbi:SH3 domain-containing protein [Bacillus cytotoxicus]|uniref:3D domain protein n=2 Tax=Bacillus cytotoxicus TaxID=580165 RepID=A0AAX2CJH9_9BACI|nr:MULTISPECIES: 3D domain-containing protein [Bacillus cereus group]ABS22631.1 3D domain protein [Bacillus cytotoxicus NVH 391-98]AWC33309.1 enterotoxin [Bacillus cytotoxicus]AWC37289.1 enterotoxin [Bacillus cytotoxicus]AWC45274.1 enterotoxin [Bacillus cytotoxicus]AWC61556.1 enterotoxin [Bacillus cytotoxicus]
MKKIVGIAIAAFFGFGIYDSSAKAETVVTTDVLNVREEPTVESTVVGKVLKGHELHVVNTENGWSQIKWNGKDVFVSAAFTKNMYYVTANALNVRAGMSASSEILGTLKKDDLIETTNQIQNGWLQFHYNGKTAYVYASFLTEKAPVKVVTPVKEKAPVKQVQTKAQVVQSKPVVQEKKQTQVVQSKPKTTSEPSGGRELTVEATAYTAHPSENGTYGGRVLTAMGHDLTANPNMKVIAVDPNVIPLGSKVWVEGYGEAIAGDTGGAIKGNRIDVLVGSDGTANQWGRKHVKVKIIK